MHDLDNPLSLIVHGFMKVIARLYLSGKFLIGTEAPPKYVGPGADPFTEDLRAVVRLLYSQTPEVPKDPFEGREVYMLSNIFASHLHVLADVATDPK